MRTFTLATAIAAAALTASAEAAVRNFGISGFTKVRVEGPYRVRLTTGIAPFGRATGSAAAIDRVALEMRGDTLVVRTNPSWGGYPGANVGPVQVEIGTHDLSGATLSGSGALAINRVKGLSFTLAVLGSGVAEIGLASADQLNVTIDGSGSARVAGSAKKMTLLARGVSSVDARALTTPHATISADGTTTIDADVTDTARVNAWGTATVRLTGGASCIVRANGSSAVSGCKSTQ